MGVGRAVLPRVSITTHDEIPHEEGLLIDTGLGDSNDLAAPLHEVRALSCFVRLGEGSVGGGAVGRTWGTCCELQQLWVDPAHRRQGLGYRLVQAFEKAALVRGCRTFYLETFSFQAPSLYRALGYEVKAELSGFASGISKFLMVREAQAGERGG